MADPIVTESAPPPDPPPPSPYVVMLQQQYDALLEENERLRDVLDATVGLTAPQRDEVITKAKIAAMQAANLVMADVPMPFQMYPKVVTHSVTGDQRTVPDAAAHEALGADWT